MRYSVTYRGYKQSGGVISLPPDPPLSTSLSHLFFKEICPIDGGNYTELQQRGTTEPLLYCSIVYIIRILVTLFILSFRMLSAEWKGIFLKSDFHFREIYPNEGLIDQNEGGDLKIIV